MMSHYCRPRMLRQESHIRKEPWWVLASLGYVTSNESQLALCQLPEWRNRCSEAWQLFNCSVWFLCHCVRSSNAVSCWMSLSCCSITREDTWETVRRVSILHQICNKSNPPPARIKENINGDEGIICLPLGFYLKFTLFTEPSATNSTPQKIK